VSRLVLRSQGLGREWELNCLQFNAPIVASISSVQTRLMQRHFPVKVNQPTIDFLVQFSSEKDFEDFQEFVRKCHKQAQINPDFPGVTLWWPERNIENWTGIIKNFRAGGMRRNYSPRATFTIDLIKSMVSKQSFISSIATTWKEVAGLGTREGLLELPSVFITELEKSIFGTTLQQAADLLNPPAADQNIINGNLGLPEGVLRPGNGG